MMNLAGGNGAKNTMSCVTVQSPPLLANSAGFVGGIRYGMTSFYAISVSYPFVRLYITQSELAFHCFGRCVRIPKDSVQRISRWRGIFSTGIRIEHSINSVEPFVVFWTSNFQQVVSALEAAGFKVAR